MGHDGAHCPAGAGANERDAVDRMFLVVAEHQAAVRQLLHVHRPGCMGTEKHKSDLLSGAQHTLTKPAGYETGAWLSQTCQHRPGDSQQHASQQPTLHALSTGKSHPHTAKCLPTMPPPPPSCTHLCTCFGFCLLAAPARRPHTCLEARRRT